MQRAFPLPPHACRRLAFFLLLLIPVSSIFSQTSTVDTVDIADTAYVAEVEVPAEVPPPKSMLARFNDWAFGILFLDITFGQVSIGEVDEQGAPVLDDTGNRRMKTVEFPFLVAWLFLGAIFFTLWYRFISIRGFKHALEIVRGKWSSESDEGEISHFRALTSALSATVGLGNIAGVAIAIQLGGPGAVFWMIVAALFGMASKFSSCTLSQMYRKVNADGSISGGPMYYLDMGLRAKGPVWAVVGKSLGVLFAIMIMFAAIGGGNMFQVNQTVEAFDNTFGIGEAGKHAVGFLMLISVGAVILGGIKRIGLATSRIVPFMVGVYILASLIIIIVNITELPHTLALIFSMAFSDNALFGGAMGVMVKGIQRAAFSNEAGLGSAAIAHAAARTKEPVREGLVAMLEPFIDTVIVCLMTAIVVIITGAWNNPDISGGGNLGVDLTMDAFRSALPWFPYILTMCIALFAYSTMISWGYYGERGWIYLLDHFGEDLGLKTVAVFRVAFVLCIYVGAINAPKDVINFADVMILSIAFPNILGSILLAPKVKKVVDDYFARYRSGKMKPPGASHRSGSRTRAARHGSR